MFDFKEKIDGYWSGMVKEAADAAFDFLKKYMVAPTDLENITPVDNLYSWILALSISLGGFLFVFALMKLMVQQMGGYSNRSIQEIVIKAIMGTLLAVFAPFLLKDVLIGINNAWVNSIIDKGINIDTLAKVLVVPQAAGSLLVITVFILALMFLVLGIQYIIRSAHLLIFFLFSSLAAVSIMNEEINIWPIWWREALATVFQQSYQITLLWAIFNLLGSGQKLTDYIYACGIMSALVVGPTFLRRLLYSTGTGRTLAGAAGGAGRMAMYKFAAKRMITK